MKTTFKKLHIFSCFDFDHAGMSEWSGANGPWRKVSARKYVKIGNPKVEHRVDSVHAACIARLDLNAGV